MFTLPLPAATLEKIWTRLSSPRRDGRVSIPAAASEVFTTLASFNMMTVQRGYLVGYQNEVIDVGFDYGGSLEWQVLVGTSSFDDDGQRTFTELRGTRIDLAQALAFVSPGQTVSIQVRRAIASATPTVCSGSISLIHWPVELEKTFPSKRN